MYEHRTERLLPRRAFISRQIKSAGLGLFLIAVSLLIGMIGYHTLEGLAWDDAFVNAAMILSGMGPLATLHTTASKVFAGMYALYSGLAILLIAGIVFAPAVHRVLHHFHLEADKADADND
jgi:hypothetical protein